MARFKKWCASIGIEMPKLDYPAFFEGGLVGCRVNAPIKHREAFVKVPYKALISVDKCNRDPVLKQFYAENQHVFGKKQPAGDQLTLTAYLIYQRQLGDASFWKEWLDMMPEVTFFYNNSKADLQYSQDPKFVSPQIGYREDLQDEYIDVLTCMKKYPGLFTQQSMSRTTFMTLYPQVCTRCFGNILGSTAMIPLADCLNHSDCNVNREMVYRKKHLEGADSGKYFNKDKYMCDYSILFSTGEIAQPEKAR